MTARATIPLLRCSAAGVPLGLAAEEVLAFGASDRQPAPPLGRLLGLAADSPEARVVTLRLRAGGRQAAVRVEGPVRIRPLQASELLACPRLLTGPGGRLQLAPVIGFAEEGGQIVVLLDVAAVIHLAGESTCS